MAFQDGQSAEAIIKATKGQHLRGRRLVVEPSHSQRRFQLRLRGLPPDCSWQDLKAFRTVFKTRIGTLQPTYARANGRHATAGWAAAAAAAAAGTGAAATGAVVVISAAAGGCGTRGAGTAAALDRVVGLEVGWGGVDRCWW